jgi:hypothetical protein
MKHLACFFKDPLDVSVHSFSDQWRMLTDYVGRHEKSPRRRSP